MALFPGLGGSQDVQTERNAMRNPDLPTSVQELTAPEAVRDFERQVRESPEPVRRNGTPDNEPEAEVATQTTTDATPFGLPEDVVRGLVVAAVAALAVFVLMEAF